MPIPARCIHLASGLPSSFPKMSLQPPSSSPCFVLAPSTEYLLALLLQPFPPCWPSKYPTTWPLSLRAAQGTATPGWDDGKPSRMLGFPCGTTEDRSDCIAIMDLRLLHLFIYLPDCRMGNHLTNPRLRTDSIYPVFRLCTCILGTLEYMSLAPTFFLSVATSIPGLHIAWHLGRHI